MARPQKTGLDYFPHDTVLDSKLRRFYLLFEAKGRSFWSAMLEEIYRDEGWCIEVSATETRLILAKECYCTPEEWDTMVARALNVGLFDEQAYRDQGILTSNGIKKRWESVAKKRKLNADYYKNRRNRVSEAETQAESSQSEGFPFTREIRSDEIKKESPISPFLKSAEGEEAPCPSLVQEVYDAYPRIRIKGGKAFPIHRSPDEEKPLIAQFVAANPDYPILEAVRLLKETADMPPDLSNFLAKPWDLQALREAAAANGKGSKKNGATAALSPIEEALRFQEENGLKIAPDELAQLVEKAEESLGFKLPPVCRGQEDEP